MFSIHTLQGFKVNSIKHIVGLRPKRSDKTIQAISITLGVVKLHYTTCLPIEQLGATLQYIIISVGWFVTTTKQITRIPYIRNV